MLDVEREGGRETTLLPVLMPLAPAATLLARAAEEIATVLAAHGAPDTIIDTEREHMRDWRIGADRQPQRRGHHERVHRPR